MSRKYKMNRRKFLKLSAAGTCSGLIHKTLTPLNDMIAFADPSPYPVIGSNPVFILINMAGGASYNVAPIYHSAYRDKNPNVSYGPENSIPLSGAQGLHPSLTGFKQIFDEGNLALANLVGYPNPNRSHADSTNIWFRGSRNMGAGMGSWAARMTCALGGVFSGISLGGSSLLTQGNCNPPLAFGDLDNLGESRFKYNDDKTEWLQIVRNNVIAASSPTASTNELYIRQKMNNMDRSIAAINAELDKPLPGPGEGAFSNSSFGRQCRDTAKLILAALLQVRFVYLERGGFDTHSNEAGRLTSNLDDMNTNIAALIATIKAMGVQRWRETTICTMSEFCRTHENGSQGTDHGHAAPMFVMGGAVRGGIKNAPPTTASGNYYADHDIDFRSVFREIVAAMGLDPAAVFPENFSLTPLGLY